MRARAMAASARLGVARAQTADANADVVVERSALAADGTRATFAIYLTPVVAVILGALFRDEVIHVLSVVGIGLVIAGALLASRKERNP